VGILLFPVLGKKAFNGKERYWEDHAKAAKHSSPLPAFAGALRALCGSGLSIASAAIQSHPYNSHMLDELQFRKHADEAFAELKRSLFDAEDDANFEVEDQSGALHISFEDGARFVVSPNAPVRQIWISALTTSFKLDWSDGEQDFVLTRTAERLKPLMARLINQQLGEEVVVLN